MNGRQYEANAQQYSYNNVVFNQQQQQQPQLQGGTQYSGPNQQSYGNPQTFNPNQNAPGVYPSNYQNQQPLRDPQQGQGQPGLTGNNGNNNNNFGVVTSNQQFGGAPESSNLQQISITNYGNSSGGEPVTEKLTITKYPNGTLVNVESNQVASQGYEVI